MELVRSRPQTILGNKGMSQPSRPKWIKRPPQSGGWIGPEVAKLPGYDLTHLLTRYKKTPTR